VIKMRIDKYLYKLYLELQNIAYDLNPLDIRGRLKTIVKELEPIINQISEGVYGSRFDILEVNINAQDTKS